MEPLVQSKPPKPRRRKIVAAILLLVLIIAGVFVWWAGSGGKATISPAAANTTTKVAADKTYNGQYVSFIYKGGYSVRRETPQAPAIEMATLKADTTFDKHIVLSVEELPGGDLGKNGAYNLRQTYTNLYSQRQLPVNGGTAIVWIKTDGTEQTAFIQRGGKVAILSFSVSGTNDPGNLQNEVDTLLNSFRWK